MPSYTLRRTWDHKPDDYVVKVDGTDAGRMYLEVGAEGRWQWHWTIYGTSRSGLPPTFEQAQAEWKAAYEALPQEDRNRIARMYSGRGAF
jgi:hypothetical protein